MYDYVSVDDALKKARRQIGYPAFTFLIIGMVASFAGVIAMSIPIYFTIVGWLITFIGVFIYVLIRIPQWRIWALENVRNIHELYELAVLEKIIPGKHSWLKKMEIMSKADKQRLEALNDRFSEPDIFIDDPLLPDELVIYYGKRESIGFITLAAVFLVVVALIFVFNDKIDGGTAIQKLGISLVLMIGMAVFFAYKGITRLRNHDPQLTVSESGIKEKDGQFIPWSVILLTTFRLVVTQRSTRRYLVYFTPNRRGTIDITPLSIKWRDLDHAIRTYKGRYKQNVNSPYTPTS